MNRKQRDVATTQHSSLNPVIAELRYLKTQPLSKELIVALSAKARVYVRGKPHQVKVLGISESGELVGKLEPLK